MPSTFKNVSIRPSFSGFDVLYTTPPNTSAIAISALCTSDVGLSYANAAHIGIAPSGSSNINWLAQNINVPINSSVNVLASKVSLSAGDRLVSNNTAAILSQPLTLSNQAPWGGTASVILSNPDGSIIVARTSSGLFTSTDGGKTASMTFAGAIGGTAAGMYYAGAFWFYTSNTSAHRSVDGMVWTTVAVTNAPQKSNLNHFGSIIITNGVAFGVVLAANQLTSSSDGITWTLTGAVLPDSRTFTGFAWTGTHWVVTHDGSTGTVYRSTNGASWSTVTVTGAVAAHSGGVAAIGGVLLAVFAGAIFTSYDHGATWAGSGIGSLTGNCPVLAVGPAFLWAQSSLVRFSTRLSPLVASVGIPDPLAAALASTQNPICIAGSRLISDTRSIKNISNLDRNAGMTVTASVVEVS